MFHHKRKLNVFTSPTLTVSIVRIREFLPNQIMSLNSIFKCIIEMKIATTRLQIRKK